VPSPDGRRVLARPNGLAGWALPQVAVDLPFAGWDDATTDAASRLLGVAVEPDAPLGEGAWTVTVERVGAAGNTWIGEHEIDRLGTDAAIARAWFARPARPEG
jgi:hypothetical protein